MRCSCVRGGVRGWLPCPLPKTFPVISNAAVMPAATPNSEQRMNTPPLLSNRKLLLLAGDRLGRALARARIGVGALAAHRQTAAMTQAAIAAEVHQTLDVDAGLAAKIAFDEIVAVDHFADLQDFLVAQLADATIRRDLDLLDDLGRVLLADAMDVLERDQNALVGRDIHAGNTGHGLLSCRRSPMDRAMFLLTRAGVRKREHDARPSIASGPGIVKNYPTWMRGLLRDSNGFRQPILTFSSPFRDFFGGF